MAQPTMSGSDDGRAPAVGRPSSSGPVSRPTSRSAAAVDAASIIAGLLSTSTSARLTAENAAAVVPHLLRHRVAGLARARGLVDEGVSGELDEAFQHTRLGTTLVCEAAARACAALSTAGIECIQFKGAALVSGGSYDDPGARPMDDADVLVRPEQAGSAVAVLTQSGFEPWEEWRPQRVAWSDSFTFSDPLAPEALPVAIDLHWRTAYGSLRSGVGVGTEGESSLLWVGADLDRHLPGAETHLLVVAEHALKHLRVVTHLLAYADLVRLASDVSDWDFVVSRARGRFFTVATGALLAVLSDELEAPVPAEVPAGLNGASRRARRIRERLGIRALLQRGGEPVGRLEGLRLRWDLAGDPAALAGDLRSVLFPPRDWLRARYGVGKLPGLWVRHTAACARWGLAGGPSPLSPNQ